MVQKLLLILQFSNLIHDSKITELKEIFSIELNQHLEDHKQPIIWLSYFCRFSLFVYYLSILFSLKRRTYYSAYFYDLSLAHWLHLALLWVHCNSYIKIIWDGNSWGQALYNFCPKLWFVFLNHIFWFDIWWNLFSFFIEYVHKFLNCELRILS